MIMRNSEVEGDHKMDALVVRAYFRKLLVERMEIKVPRFDVFLTGLFSLMDALLNRPIGEI
jgi:c-di-GMP-related signal transduction protein